jgi:hypothetical protein
MVRACTADSIERAEEYASLLREQGLEAFVKETETGAVRIRTPEVWVSRAEEVPGAVALLRAHFGRRLGPEDDPPAEGRMRRAESWVRYTGAALWVAAGVSLFESPRLCGALLATGVVLVAGSGVLVRFRRFRLVDLFALTCFLPAALGLSVRDRGFPLSLGGLTVLYCLTLCTLVSWGGVVLFLESENSRASWARFFLHTAAFGLLAAVWWVAVRASGWF